jgi:hypothetical protein
MTTEQIDTNGVIKAYDMFVGKRLDDLKLALLVSPAKHNLGQLNAFLNSKFLHDEVKEPVAWLAGMPDELIKEKIRRVGPGVIATLNIALNQLASMEIPKDMYRE